MIATQPVALVANKGVSRQQRGRSRRAREEERRQARLHLARSARRRAPRRRNAQAARRHRNDPHQLQRQRAGADRPDRRARAADVRHLAFGEALCRFRRTEADRRRRRGAARRHAAGADHRGNLSRLRRDRFQRGGGARRNAESPLLEKISADIRAVVDSREFAEKTKHLGIFPKGNTPGELDAWMREQTARWAEIAKAANIKAE